MGKLKGNQSLTTSITSKLDRKGYRDAFIRSNVSHGIAYQIKTIRKYYGISQNDLAIKIGAKSQSIISRLEDPSYGKISITTLEKIASALDVALIVKFSSFGEFLNETKKTLMEKTYNYEEEKLMNEKYQSNCYMAIDHNNHDIGEYSRKICHSEDCTSFIC